MSYPVIHSCPVCDKKLHVTKLECAHCNTTIENKFSLTKLASLSQEQMRFVETFIICRGNIKEVEKELGISYPTVRGKLGEVIEILQPKKEKELPPGYSKAEIITLLESNELSVEEAVALLKNREE